MRKIILKRPISHSTTEATDILLEARQAILLMYIRILKELGIFNTWIKYRKKRISNSDMEVFPPSYTFSGFINQSFCWADTEVEELWHFLFQQCSTMGVKEIIHNMENIKDMIADKGFYEPYRVRN